MPRFAAIDVGSNASRLLIVSAKDAARVRTVQSVRVPIRLGHAVFQTGRLDLDTIDRCIAAMHDFAAEMKAQKVDEYRAVVTASARSAKNADLLVERVREETGINLVSIDGTEEARLVGMAVRDSMPLSGPTLLMDLGGGSLELTELHREGFTTSLAIGTVRMLEAFMRGGEPVDEAQDRIIREYIDRLLTPHLREIRAEEWAHLVGTGGNLVAASRLCPGKTEGRSIDVEAARAMLAELSSMSATERAEKHGLRQDRADVIVPALYVIVAMGDLARVSTIDVPGVGLKDGIIRERVDKHFHVWDYNREDDKVFGAALHLGRRYHFDERHARHVAEGALKIFDGTLKLHRASSKSRAMLHIAALLHDVGDFVNPMSHHKHSQYIIENSELMGLKPEDRKMIALIARYHRRAMPSPRHNAYQSLSAENRDRVKTLAAILRIADALDRGHRGKTRDLMVKVKKGSVVLEVKSSEDLSLEVWTVERKAELFRNVFGRDIRVKVKADKSNGKHTDAELSVDA